MSPYETQSMRELAALRMQDGLGVGGLESAVEM